MTRHWYVYHLVDPRDREVFYVGKGTGSRIRSHESEARRGVTSEKCKKIREIWADDLPVERLVAQTFTSELEALRFEAREIERIGLDKLTNRSEGYCGRWPFNRKDEQAMARLIRLSQGFKYEIKWGIPENSPKYARDTSVMLAGILNRAQVVKRSREALVSLLEKFGFEHVNKRFEKFGITFRAA